MGFNRLHAGRMSVGKTFVADTIRRHRYEIRACRATIRRRRGRPGSINRVWGLDLTGKTDESGQLNNIVGLIDHGSRASLTLTALPARTTIVLLRVLFDAIERYGMPGAIRTDNESIFTGRTFRLVLWLLGIRHEKTELHCPWMNGRIERLFGTLKQKLNCWIVSDIDGLNASLTEFRTWYNSIRPHQSLHGRTPAEIWNGTDSYRRHHRRAYWYEAWDGLLTGIYIPP